MFAPLLIKIMEIMKKLENYICNKTEVDSVYGVKKATFLSGDCISYGYVNGEWVEQGYDCDE